MNKITLILLLIIGFSACDSGRYQAEEKFAAVQKNLMSVARDLTENPPKDAMTNEPYVRGKIAVFNKGKIALQKGKDYVTDPDGKTYFMTPLYFQEMQEHYAATPEEVSTVAVVNCEMLKKGVYKTADGRDYPAEVEDCELTMIDRSQRATVFRKKFEKTPSQERTAYGNSISSQSSQQDILQFLKNLPRS